MSLDALQQRLGCRFSKPELLQQALTHRSHSAIYNERLGFLGDSILNCTTAGMLYSIFSKLDENDLSRVRANSVKQRVLYKITRMLQSPDALRLDEGELKNGGFRRPSILADALEAIFGAVFLDGDFDAARTLIRKLYIPILEQVDPHTLDEDAKTLLQEYLQGRKIALPLYMVVITHGVTHNQRFEIKCSIPKLEVRVSGSGVSRYAVEQSAAKLALGGAHRLVSQLVECSRAERTGKTRERTTPSDPQLSLRLKE